MNTLPPYLIDKFLTFNTPNEIIKLQKINKYFKNTINDLTHNKNSFIQKIYNLIHPINNIKTWLFTLDLDILKELIYNYNDFYKLILMNIKCDKYKFKYLFNNFRTLYDDSQSQYQNKIVILFFILVENNFDIFYEKNFSSREKYIFHSYLLYLIDLSNSHKDNDVLLYLEKIFNHIFLEIKNNDKSYFCYLIQDSILLNRRFSNHKLSIDIILNGIYNNNLESKFILLETYNEDDDYNDRVFFSDF